MSNYNQLDSVLVGIQSDNLLEQVHSILELLLQPNLTSTSFAMGHVWLA